jgi:hypothetical protein
MKRRSIPTRLQWTQSNSVLRSPLQIQSSERGEALEAIATGRQQAVLCTVLLDVKLLRLGCRSSAYVLRRVSALLEFYSSFGPQNTVWWKSQCIKMPPTVSKLKRKDVFSYTLGPRTQTLCRLALCCSFTLSVTKLKLGVIFRLLYMPQVEVISVLTA